MAILGYLGSSIEKIGLFSHTASCGGPGEATPRCQLGGDWQ